jgi:hypothetical protein
MGMVEQPEHIKKMFKEANEEHVKSSKWIRWRFETKSLKDYRPVIWNPGYPWWCSGFNDVTATIIVWLPNGEKVRKYWPDAKSMEAEGFAKIKFWDRFPMPKSFIGTDVYKSGEWEE